MPIQSQFVGRLQTLVRSVPEFRRAEEKAEIVCLPAGDGMALAFFRDCEAPLRCAIELSVALQNETDLKDLKLRMGIHSGPADRASDINDAQNIRGNAINFAQRVMDCGDAGHILLSGTAADFMLQLGTWSHALHDLGEQTIKNTRIRIFNFYTPGVGNSEMPKRLHVQPQKSDNFTNQHNLPFELTSFLGRDGELVEVREALERYRLVTIVGPAGCGKSRLSTEAAASLASDYRDGVWLIELGGVPDVNSIAETTASIFRIKHQDGRLAEESLVEGLRDQRTLIIFDNCEHVIDASANLITMLLRRCPHLRIIATSREHFNIDGERVVDLKPLGPPDPAAGIEALRENAALRLFCDRAHRLSASSASHEQLKAIREICTELDGLPLAIELAAARTQSLALEEIKNRLSDCFSLLTTTARSKPRRQLTMEAALDWSFNLLSKEEALVFTRLSVFSGSWSLEAANAVCGAGVRTDMQNMLDVLAAKSLITCCAGVDKTRYSFLRTTHEYARRKLTVNPPESEDLRRRHAQFFVNLIQSVPAKFMEVCGEEYGNLQAALAWCLEHSDPGALVFARLSSFWREKGLCAQGAQWVDALLQQSGPKEHARNEAVTLRRFVGSGRRAAKVLSGGAVFGNDAKPTEN